MRKNQRKLELKRISISILASVTTLALAAGGFSVIYNKRTLPFLTVGTLEVGNKSREELEIIIKNLKPQPFKITAQTESAALDHMAINLEYDAVASAQKIVSLSQPRAIYALEFLVGQQLVAKYEKEKLEKFISDFAKKVDKKYRDAAVDFKNGKLTIDDKTQDGLELDKDFLRTQIVSRFTRYDFSDIEAKVKVIKPTITAAAIEESLPELEAKLKNSLILDFNDEGIKIEPAQLFGFLKLENKSNGVDFAPNQDKIKAYVKTLAKQIDKTVKDAQLKIVNGKVEVFQASREGRKIDQDKTVKLIVNAIESGETTVKLPMTVTEPRVATGSINDLGIQELIGVAATNFKGSPENRKHNISIGAGLLNGIIIMPRQTFSTLDALGSGKDITGEQGYLPELVIKENKTIPEFGGGLCQVSTTLFRAALNAGLPINERRNHSWRISYYEPPYAIDATVYYPNTDLKFTNNTPGAIVIQSKIEGTTLTFEFYGTKDGRRGEVSSKMLSTIPAPGPEYIETDTLPRGETKQTGKPHPGGKGVAYYKVYDKNGNLVINETYSSSYKPVPARFLVGTAEPTPAPPPTETPTESPPSQ